MGPIDNLAGTPDAILTASNKPTLLGCLHPLEIAQYICFSSTLNAQYNQLKKDKHIRILVGHLYTMLK